MKSKQIAGKKVKFDRINDEKTITYARVACCSCHEAFYVRTNDPGVFVIPDFIQEGEVFSSGHCPVCERGDGFVRFLTYIETKDRKGVQSDNQEN